MSEDKRLCLRTRSGGGGEAGPSSVADSATAYNDACEEPIQVFYSGWVPFACPCWWQGDFHLFHARQLPMLEEHAPSLLSVSAGDSGEQAFSPPLADIHHGARLSTSLVSKHKPWEWLHHLGLWPKHIESHAEFLRVRSKELLYRNGIYIPGFSSTICQSFLRLLVEVNIFYFHHFQEPFTLA